MRRMTLVACLVCLGVAAGWWHSVDHGSPARAAPLAAVAARPEPLSEFAVIRSPGGANPTLEVRSARTGRIVKSLGPVGSAWTNNGFAFSRAAGAVYLTTIGRNTLHIERVDVATGHRAVVADGEQPAFSVDGHQLAYASGGLLSTVVAVRDLRSGHERRIDLARWLGSSYELLNSSIAWTGDGTTIAVLAAHVATADAATARPAGRGMALSPRSCTARGQQLCVVAIRVPGSGALAARALTIHVRDRGVFEAATDPRDPRSVYLTGAVGLGSVVYRIDLRPRLGRTAHVASLARGLLVAAASTQPRILYLQGSPPALWRADITSGRLTHRHELIPNAWFEAGSW